jgi:hypothetical protein
LLSPNISFFIINSIQLETDSEHYMSVLKIHVRRSTSYSTPVCWLYLNKPKIKGDIDLNEVRHDPCCFPGDKQNHKERPKGNIYNVAGKAKFDCLFIRKKNRNWLNGISRPIKNNFTLSRHYVHITDEIKNNVSINQIVGFRRVTD